MKAPFPWFGGKSKVADIVWQEFGEVQNYVEPFAGSLAVLLSRPHDAKTETVNDIDCYLANFWRALSNDADGVAHWADWPVNEADLSARHQWLVNQSEFRERMKVDPDFYDVKIAGWWVWGLCAWIGDGWCKVGNAGCGVNRKLPHLGNAGQGVNRQGFSDQFLKLSKRLRRVRVACGDWSRVLTDAVTTKHGITGVFLDPPYDVECKMEYATDSTGVSSAVREWAISNGDNPLLRIAFCGYEGEHQDFPDGWRCHAWKANGGYGSQSNNNSSRERIWFSPHCLGSGKQLSIFE